ncbi:MAG: methyl-accepting chemotaxis protein [Acidovorax sp.]|jgi:twitching motility protein PilJ|uniref:methyl-accepting chemotaxis protein n=1 Tax=Acidovorax sp. TaxID=1872122 RepID=UPI00260B26D9|nr:methyl-accepting chemotaxis protein [Acidovorax sp.]MDH4427319.1 methyl-accepting chemotaxis protein [Acidovorax sp.]
MSVVDQLKNLFSKKQPESELDSRLSLAMPDATVNSAEHETLQESQNAPLQAPAPSLADEPVVPEGELISIPILGRRTVVQHQRTLFVLLGGALVVLAGVTFYALNQSDRVAQQLGATGQSLMQSQRLAKSVSQAVVGSAQAFPDVSDSSGILSKSVKGLQSGDDEMRINALNEDFAPELGKVIPLVERADKNAKAVIAQQKMLTQIGSALRLINRQSSDLLEVAETVASLKLQQNAPAAEISAVGQLVMLTQRIGKSSNEFLTAEGVSPEAVFLLGKDLNTFKEISEALLSGSTELRLTATKDAATREQLEALIKMYEETRVQAGAILGNLQGLVSAREAQGAIIADSEPLRRNLEDLQAKLSGQAGIGGASLALLVVAALFALVCAGGLSYVQLQDSRKRQVVAEDQRLEAERQEQEAKRVNDANQAAILRLMNELQTVAEGDLTQEATVTEDITGAIADSVNYTVEELRSLVSNVQNTAARVAQTTADVDATSTELLAASNEQLHEIRETGKSVLDMAGRINEVSAQAQESATVARQSLQAAESGLQAVQNAIGGMNSIRDQIQETSKRIKRLGESSQEIGEITELISDITEQTNVLALNAAIQAASAGEAGRGFSVVAEEVQRLAERSADATRQIAALVKAIQTDTQDAIGAMERSTQGVVEGAKLSDNAGTALTEIDRVSRQVADLIEQISNAASREAGLANVVADNIQHIFAVTEQTGEGTRATANQVRELSRMAEELRQSVSRFKIS